MRNLYKVLGVGSSADDQRIKTVFRRRAKAVHPDLNPGKRRAEERFIELMQAYEVLSDAKHRAAYDAYLAEQRSQSRRRLVHCAGLMMTSFMLTAASAVLLMSIAGANIPLRETWQLAIAAISPADAKAPAAEKDGQKGGWTTQVAVAPDSPAASPDHATSAPDAKLKSRTKARPRPVMASSKAPTAKSRQGAPDAPADAKAPRRQLATASKQAPSVIRRPEVPPSSSAVESWPPQPPADEPRYSLGASDLR